jgi:hypothetical protein
VISGPQVCRLQSNGTIFDLIPKFWWVYNPPEPVLSKISKAKAEGIMQRTKRRAGVEILFGNCIMDVTNIL